MPRLNLTLDEATLVALRQDARRVGARVTTHGRRLLGDALARQERARRRQIWAEASSRDRGDARRLAGDLEPISLELLGDEDE
jgi:hypothetical protein